MSSLKWSDGSPVLLDNTLRWSDGNIQGLFELPKEEEPSFVAVLKRWNGVAWVPACLKRYNGSEWVLATLRVYKDGDWGLVDTSGS